MDRSETISAVDSIGRAGDLAKLWAPETLAAIAALDYGDRMQVLRNLRFFFGNLHSPGQLRRAVDSQVLAVRQRRPRSAEPPPRRELPPRRPRPPKPPKPPRVPWELRFATDAERAAWLADRAPADVPMVQANRAGSGPATAK